MPDPGTAAEHWLDRHGNGASADAVLTFFDGLPAVSVPELTGRWRGSDLPTGSSPLDGLLPA